MIEFIVAKYSPSSVFCETCGWTTRIIKLKNVSGEKLKHRYSIEATILYL